MASIGNPKPWAPYMNRKDCSQGFCSLYCPQWCYMVMPPPPPAYEFPNDDSSPNLSPLVIAIIGILASAFLLMTYYTIISKYCTNTNSSPTRERHAQEPQFEEETRHPSLHEPWHAPSAGLDEALIKSITALKFKKGERLVEGTDCSVCLSEFEEDEKLRLLPKCSHAFHVQCIDTWLKSHSNCPLCRASIALVVPPEPESTPIIIEPETVRAVGQTVIDVRPDDEGGEPIRRSVSMSCLSQNRVSVADILCIGEGEDDDDDDGDVGSSKRSSLGFKKSRESRMCPVEMKRSFSSGRFFLTGRYGCRVGRGKAIVHV